MRTLPVVLLALPLGELSPKVTERAHAVSPVAKVSSATRNFPAMPKGSPLGELANVVSLRGYGWRSEKSVKAIAPTGAALAFLCFDFFFRIVKGEQPLTCCGVGGVQR